MLRTVQMAKAYSDDFRPKLLDAHDAGEGILEDLAERFRVSKVTPEIESFIKAVVQTRADTTLAELQLRRLEERQLPVIIGWLWEVLNRIGLRYKKRYAPPNRISPGSESSGSSGRRWSAR